MASSIFLNLNFESWGSGSSGTAASCGGTSGYKFGSFVISFSSKSTTCGNYCYLHCHQESYSPESACFQYCLRNRQDFS